jgi:hypothetical protein
VTYECKVYVSMIISLLLGKDVTLKPRKGGYMPCRPYCVAVL